jgi:hypothetical protein
MDSDHDSDPQHCLRQIILTISGTGSAKIGYGNVIDPTIIIRQIEFIGITGPIIGKKTGTTYTQVPYHQNIYLHKLPLCFESVFI